MPRKKQYQNLYVYMNGIAVGTLVRESTGQLIFTYDPHWLNLKNSRPISLSMPLTEIPYKGYKVDCYFENLLPDNELIRERIQARFNAPSKKCFDLLSFIGGDCVGALQLLTQPNPTHVKKIRAFPIEDEIIASLLKHYKTAPLGMAKEFDFRISIAGAQEKTALLWYQGKWCLPSDTTPTSHIIKLPIGNIPHSGIDLSESIENEWLCLQILSAFGLPVNQAKIVQFNDVKTLVVERFDRRWADNNRWLMRLPQEDLCQALGKPPGLKYESDGGPGMQDIMNILIGSQEASNDRKKFMKSVFLFWALGAIDGHAKNFSLRLEPQSRYQLTPLYDVISAYPIAAKRQTEWQALKMAMSLKGKNCHYLWGTIQPRHWFSMAEKCQFSPTIMQEIMSEVFDTMENIINQVTQILPPHFPSHICESIFLGMRQIKNRSTNSITGK
ncbi:MAG: HipA N-terminal domain protein [Gammaproteobacteria bacterium]|nr:HipA N-terminal domain protein [Gammaproteobacteria bacterium]